jgi:DNA-binding SARP family transcriptional activator
MLAGKPFESFEPFELCVLNGFILRARGVAVPLPASAKRVAAFLALQDHPVQRGFVAGTLWPDTSERRSTSCLRTALWRLSKPASRLVETISSYLALAAWVKVDVRECCDRARRVVRDPQTWQDEDVTSITAAGDVLPDFYEDWVLLERERFRQLRMHALETLSLQLLSAGRYAEAVETGLAAVAAEPLRESAHRAVVAAHLREGNRGEAIRQYVFYRDLLQKELGLKPSPAMAELMRGLVAT